MQKMIDSRWAVLKSSELQVEVEHRVREVASRLQDLERLQQHYEFLARQAQTKVTNYSSNGFDLGHGYAGVCLLFGELDRLFPEEGWDLIGRDLLIVMKDIITESTILPLSMWGGVAGVCMAVRSLSRGGERYQGFLAQLDEVLLTHLPETLERAIRHLEEGVRADDFDVIHGLVGMGRYLLYDLEQLQKRDLFAQTLAYLVRLCGDSEREGRRMPNWFIRADRMISPIEAHYFPQGHFNLGLSHGIPGVIALFALALQQGIEVDGQREALVRTAEWVWQARSEGEEGISWSPHLSYENWVEPGSHPIDWKRDAWCYGTPGVAYALYLAGEALGDPEQVRRALHAYRSIFQRAEDKWGLYSPTLCHGYAGLMHLTQRLYAKTGDATLAEQRDALLKKVMAQYREDSIFGYYDLKAGSEEPDDYPGLLEGAAGTAIALLSLISPQSPEWDAAFLLS